MSSSFTRCLCVSCIADNVVVVESSVNVQDVVALRQLANLADVSVLRYDVDRLAIHHELEYKPNLFEDKHK